VASYPSVGNKPHQLPRFNALAEIKIGQKNTTDRGIYKSLATYARYRRRDRMFPHPSVDEGGMPPREERVRDGGTDIPTALNKNRGHQCHTIKAESLD
jgi:hypothetical protein